jgi:hypothetical protein
MSPYKDKKPSNIEGFFMWDIFFLITLEVL